MSDTPSRYLGFAFACADLLFEIDGDGRMAFVMGASQRVLGMEQANATGLPWREIIAETDHHMVEAMLESLGPADRRGPVKVELRPLAGRGLRRFAHLSACRLPQLAPSVSCVLSMGAAMSDAIPRPPAGPHGLHDTDGFLTATRKLLDVARAAGLDLNLELVELPGLEGCCNSLPEGEADTLLRRLASAIRSESFQGEGAARVGPEHYALIRDRAESPDYLASRVQKAAEAAGAKVEARTAGLRLTPESETLTTMRALRFALDSFLKDGSGSARTAFSTVLTKTVSEARAFSTAVQARRFELMYQPVVDMGSGELQHFEALVRLNGEESPARTIRMAEELDLIEALDRAVIERAVDRLKTRDGAKLKLSVNLSACSLMRPQFMSGLLDLIRPEPGLCDRLLFEITESAAFEDLDQANTAIQRLRQYGFAVCLDDFGAGAASMAYLRAFSVDAIKIDGQYVREVAESGRDSALVRHLAQLCDELAVSVVAEAVETGSAAQKLLAIGVRYGQGWHFGRPSREPVYQPPQALRARRVGEVDSWS